MPDKEISNPINWAVNSFRITVFPVLRDGNISLNQEYVSKLWPKNTDAVLKNTIVSSELGQITLEGEYKNKKLLLVAMPFKIDLVVLPKVQVDVTTASLQTLGIYDEIIDDLNALAESWIKQDNFPPIQRFAVAPELVSRIKSHDEAYVAISQYLPFDLEPSTSSDFRYQINKFVSSNVITDLKINRVTAWDVLKINLQLSTMQTTQAPIRYDDLYYCHLTLDINTDLENQNELNKDKLPLLCRELISYTETISKEGMS